MSLSIEKNWKYYLGLVLFFLSFLPYVISALILPFIHITAQVLSIMAVIAVGAEITFAASVVLLGKPFIQMLKAKIKNMCFKKQETPKQPKPISKCRHYIGVSFMLISFIPYFITEIALLFDYPQTSSGHLFYLLMLLAGDAIFIIAIFLLGDRFWDNLKRLFEYQPQQEK